MLAILLQVFGPILEALRQDAGWRFLMSDNIAGSHQTDELVEGVRAWLAGGSSAQAHSCACSCFGVTA